jgi:CRISPR type IV-associated protein Csf3
VTPLHIVAHVRGAIMATSAHPMLDALLAAAVATRDGIPPDPIVDIAIPIARSACGRVYLASQGVSREDEHSLRYLNKRFPLAEAQLMAGPKVKRVNMASGPSRSYRIPLDTCHVEGDKIEWWCIGDEREVEALLMGWVGYLGKKRSVGLGRVMHWHVEECEPWDGFPVLRDGHPMRPLPADWPGLVDGYEPAYRVLSPPYWQVERQELCAVPAWT